MRTWWMVVNFLRLCSRPLERLLEADKTSRTKPSQAEQSQFGSGRVETRRTELQLAYSTNMKQPGQIERRKTQTSEAKRRTDELQSRLLRVLSSKRPNGRGGGCGCHCCGCVGWLEPRRLSCINIRSNILDQTSGGRVSSPGRHR